MLYENNIIPWNQFLKNVNQQPYLKNTYNITKLLNKKQIKDIIKITLQKRSNKQNPWHALEITII